jgi:hypothetical protein
MKPIHESPAARRVGTTPESQARWLISLAYRYEVVADMATVPSEDVQVMLEEMEVFLPDDPARPSHQQPRYKQERYALRWLIRIRNGIRNLNKGRAWSHKLVTHYNFWVPLAGQTTGARMSPGYIRPRRPDVLHQSKTQKDLMAHKICVTLASIQASLRRCQRKGCGRLFIANKRQSYCTPVCNGRARTHRYRAKQRQVVSSSSSSTGQ